MLILFVINLVLLIVQETVTLATGCHVHQGVVAHFFFFAVSTFQGCRFGRFGAVVCQNSSLALSLEGPAVNADVVFLIKSKSLSLCAPRCFLSEYEKNVGIIFGSPLKRLVLTEETNCWFVQDN